MSTILIQIASYRDPQLLPTLRDCIAKARHPDRLRFAICWQRDEDDSLEEFLNDPRFRIIDVDYRKSPGVGWARMQTQQQYDGETYTMQIDSHHRFADGWDESCIAMMNATDSGKPIITAYAPAFDPFNEDKEREVTPWALKFDYFSQDGALLIRPDRIEGWEQLSKPIPGRYWSGHFSFTHGSFCTEVPYDPNYYFQGEEIAIGVRAYTHGYDLFYPHRTVIWHEYTRKYRTKHWDDHVAEKLAGTPWHERNQQSARRIRILFGMEEGDIDFGPYGFGSVRTLADYEAYAGVNFRLRLIQPYTLENKPPPNPEVYTSDEEWLEKATKEMWTRIRLSREFADKHAECDFWYVGVHDRMGGEMYRTDLTREGIDAVLAQDTPSFIHLYRASEKASTWTVWPHSKEHGWMEKITGEIA